MNDAQVGSAAFVRLGVIFVFVAGMALIIALGFADPGDSALSPYRSPFDVAWSPDGKTLAVTDRTAGTLAFVDPTSNAVTRQVELNGQPTGVAWAADGSRVFAAEYGSNSVAEIDPANGQVTRRLEVGSRPVGIALASKRGLLLTANSARHSISAIDLATGKEKAKIEVVRDPFAIAVTPDESLAVVSNLLPSGNASESTMSAALSLIDLEKLERVADIRLLGGSTALREVAVSPDGRWAYGVHTLGRFTLPTTQLERGWVNTNALTIFDLAGRKLYATVLLDTLTEGAADPWGVVVSKDGRTMWITLAGVNQVAKIALGDLHDLLEGKISEEYAKKPGFPEVWREIAKDPTSREKLSYDLTALYAADLIVRTPLPVKAPRGADLSPDGKRLATAAYFSGQVFLFDTETAKPAARIALGPESAPDQVRLGEMIFHDATYCFQHWLSCATCHPEGGRADALNWDLLNDGIGNPKNTKSLVYSHLTPPAMSHGVRASMEVAALAGFRFILFREPATEEVEAVRAYIRSLEPEPSPYRLADGNLSEAAVRGRAIFENSKTGCASCHPEPLFTDLKMHRTGTRAALDQKDEFDTPTLLELWRTGPYLHSGEAVDMKEAFTQYNKADRHGVTSYLSESEIGDLVEYLLSL